MVEVEDNNMKKLVLAILLSVSPMYAEYISSPSVVVTDQPKGKQVSTLTKGTQVSIIETKDSFLQIKSGAVTGWVHKFVVAKSLDLKKSVLSTASLNARVNARKRASSDVTAASARGLMEDSNLRNRTDKSLYLESEVKKMEIFIPESELIVFLKG